MSLITNQTNLNKDKYFFIRIDAQQINTSSITAGAATLSNLYVDTISSGVLISGSGLLSNLYVNSISSGSLTAELISTSLIQTSTISASNIFGYNNYLDYIKNINIVTDILTLDQQGITANPGGIYLNGVLVATPGGASAIDKWSLYPAISHIDANHSTIKNIEAISTNYISSGIIRADTIRAIGGRIDTLFGFDQVNYPFAVLDNITASQINTSSLYVNDINSEEIYNQFDISTFSIHADQGTFQVANAITLNATTVNAGSAIISNNLYANRLYTNIISSGQIYSDYISSLALNGNEIQADIITANSIAATGNMGANAMAITQLLVVQGNSRLSSIQTNYLSSGLISSGVIKSKEGYFSTLYAGNLAVNYISTGFISVPLINAKQGNFSTIYAGNLVANNINISSISTTSLLVSSIVTNNISTGVISAGNGTFNNLYTNNIYNSSNVNTSNLQASNIVSSNNTNLNNLTANGALYFNNNLAMNGDINFPFNDIHSILFPEGLAQFLNDINSVRNVAAEQVFIMGGSTGDEFEPPYRNHSYLTVGNSDGVFDQALGTPSETVLNGVNGYVPGVSGNLTNALTVRGDCAFDYGTPTFYNGASFYPFNLDADAISIYGFANITGAANILGNLFVGGVYEVVGAGIVGGNMNVGGIFTTTGLATLTGGCAITGAFLVQGVINFNTQVGGESIVFKNYGNTVLCNGLSVYNNVYSGGTLQNVGNVRFNNNLIVDGTITGSTIANYANISTIQVSSIFGHSILLSGTSASTGSQPIISFTDKFFNTSNKLQYTNQSLTFDGSLNVDNSLSGLEIYGSELFIDTIRVNGGDNIVFASPIDMSNNNISNVNNLIVKGNIYGSTIANYANISTLQVSSILGHSILLSGTVGVDGTVPSISFTDAFNNTSNKLEYNNNSLYFDGGIGANSFSATTFSGTELFIDNIYLANYDDITVHTSFNMDNNNISNVSNLYIDTIHPYSPGIPINLDGDVSILGHNIDGIHNLSAVSSIINSINTSTIIGFPDETFTKTLTLEADTVTIPGNTFANSLTANSLTVGSGDITFGSIGDPQSFVVSYKDLLQYAPVNVFNNVDISGNLFMNYHDISGVNSLKTYTSYFGIPDSSDYTEFRRWNTGYFSYSNVGDSDFKAVASDWSAFQATQDINVGFNNIVQANRINVDYIAPNANGFLTLEADVIGSGKNISDYNDINAYTLTATNTVITSNVNASGTTFTNNISTGNIATDVLYTNAIGNIYGNDIKINNSFNFQNFNINNANINNSEIRGGGIVNNSVSTINLSTGRLYAGITSTLQLSASSINCFNASINSLTGSGSATTTTNLYPRSAGSVIGYGANIAQGGFYQQGNFRSTFTQVIHPSLDAGIYSNIVRIQGNTLAQNINVSSIFTSTISTNTLLGSNVFINTLRAYNTSRINCEYLQPLTDFTNTQYELGSALNRWARTFQASTITSVLVPLNTGVTANGNIDINSTIRVLGTLSTLNQTVSTINRKQYPFCSSIGFVSSFLLNGCNNNPTQLFSTITFPYTGTYNISQKCVVSRLSGTDYARGCILYTSTNTANILRPNSNDGYSQLPIADITNFSTYTTLNTNITIGPNNLSRDIKYFDVYGGFYSANVYLERPVITYIPTLGFNPE